ncbi:SDR family oxidoreductase [Cohnella fermenti]|uniref:SDR family oxidoreductase n=1 Tax=Cohnella fermenti TaxID=2565925 RepID=A0A4S4C769_9BACL|nr:SDR family NAD(P)-dependent oxidoreductase [Cohnella fermenti]THF81617.1 SDR family oxidoreductase [Cohnella fermenti]
MEKSGAYQGRLRGKVALVTGGASGIGLATAIRMAEEGAKVAILGRDEQELKQASERIVKAAAVAATEAGDGTAEAGESRCMTVLADIANERQVKEAMESIGKRWGRLDILFANAGVNGVLAPLEEMELEDWETTIWINLTGTFLCVKHAIGPMKEAGGGSIVITSSVNGNRIFSNFGFSAYSSSKAGEVALAQMAALELARYRIRVNAVCPGSIRTNIGENTEREPEVDEIVIPVEYPEGNQPLRHAPGDPRQVANVVLFLASPEADHVTGSVVYVDGAESLLRG